MMRTRTTILLAGCAAIAFGTGAHAQQTQPDNAATTVDEVVVTGSRVSTTATKTETSLIETPQSISIIPRETLDIRNVQNIEEALRLTAGVTVDQNGFDPRYDQVSLRGFTATIFGDFRDGLRQASGNSTYYRTESYGLDALEVFRGPSSVLYGQNAPGGLINRVTKHPTFAPINEVQVDVGNFDRYQLKADFGRSTSDGALSARLTGLYRDSGTQLDRAPDDRTFVAGAVTWAPSEQTSLTLLAHFLEDDATSTPFVFTRPDGTPTTIRYGDPSWDAFNQQQFQAGYEFAHRFNDNVQFKQIFRTGQIELSQEYLFPVPGGLVGDTLYRYVAAIQEDLETYAIDNQLVVSFDTGGVEHKVLVGADYSRADYDFSTQINLGVPLDLSNPTYGFPTPTLLPYIDSNQSLEQYGVYVQDQARLGKLILTLGGRYDWAESDTFTNDILSGGIESTAYQKDESFSGRVGLTYRLDNGLAPYFSYSTSFQLTPGIDFFGDPFQPSEGKQAEIGLKYDPSFLRGFFTLAVFDLTQENVLTPDPDPAHPGFSVQTAEITSRGVEAEMSLRPIPGLSLLGSFTYQDLSPEQQVTPTYLASLFADYTFGQGPLTDFGFGGALRYVGSSPASVAGGTPALADNDAKVYLDLALHYDLGKVRLQLNSSNVTDEKGFVCSFSTCAQSIERTVIGSIRYRW